jgi:hypothetical protein
LRTNAFDTRGSKSLKLLGFFNSKIIRGKVTGYGIHWAAINDNDRLMEHILQSDKFDTKVLSSCRKYALHFASKYGRCKVMKRLFEDGNATDSNGNTAN